MRSEQTPELSRQALRELKTLAGAGGLLTDPADCWPYGYDSSRRQVLPQAVVFITTPEQLTETIALCNRLRIPVTARGRGTGTTGASVPDRGGIVLSFERMARIVRIDPANRLAVVEPGVTNEALQRAVGELGFFWPPDPSSASVCTVGGNLACNAAGPQAVKYGTPRENTLGLTAVTGAGEWIRAGVSTTKGVVGYDLTRLIIGSEGTLALITGATLELTPLPQAKRTLRATYSDVEAAATAVSAIMAQPVVPCALELMDGTALEVARGYAELNLPSDTGALLMIEVDGPERCIEEATQAVADAARVAGIKELKAARDNAELAGLWKARQALAPALRQLAPKRINEDVVVPVSRMADLINGPGDTVARSRNPHRQLRPRRQRQHPCQPAGRSRSLGSDGTRRTVPGRSVLPGHRAGGDHLRRAWHRNRKAGAREARDRSGCLAPDAGYQTPVRPQRDPQTPAKRCPRSEASRKSCSYPVSPCFTPLPSPLHIWSSRFHPVSLSRG